MAQAFVHVGYDTKKDDLLTDRERSLCVVNGSHTYKLYIGST